MSKIIERLKNTIFKKEDERVNYEVEVERFFKAFDKGTQGYAKAYEVLKIYISGEEPKYISDKAAVILRQYHFVDGQNKFNNEALEYIKSNDLDNRVHRRETTKLNSEGLKSALNNLENDADAYDNHKIHSTPPRYASSFDSLKQELSPKLLSGNLDIAESEV